MAYSESDIVSHMENFAETSRLDRILLNRTIREAGVVGAAALDQWSTGMGKALPEISVDWKQFSLSIVKLTLYDIHLLVGKCSAAYVPLVLYPVFTCFFVIRSRPYNATTNSRTSRTATDRGDRGSNPTILFEEQDPNVLL